MIDRIVREWGKALANPNAGITAEQLRELLLAMRADQLLAASLAGSLDGLRNVVSASLLAETEVKPWLCTRRDSAMPTRTSCTCR